MGIETRIHQMTSAIREGENKWKWTQNQKRDAKDPSVCTFFFSCHYKTPEVIYFWTQNTASKTVEDNPCKRKTGTKGSIDSAHTLYICPFLAHVTPRFAPCLRTFWEGETLRLTLVRPPRKGKWSLSFTSTLVRRNPRFFFLLPNSDFFSILVPIRYYNQVVPVGGWFWILSER